METTINSTSTYQQPTGMLQYKSMGLPVAPKATYTPYVGTPLDRIVSKILMIATVIITIVSFLIIVFSSPLADFFKTNYSLYDSTQRYMNEGAK